MLNYPIKLNDDYTCQGTDALGKSVTFTDLLWEGDRVGPVDEDEAEAMYVDGIVVLKDDGLWVVAL